MDSDRETLKTVSLRLPIPLLEQADTLASDQGLAKSEFYRKCFSRGLSLEYEDACKQKTYGKLKRREQNEVLDEL